MGQNELLAKVTELKELKVMAEELADQIAALEDAVKAEMTTQGVESMLVGAFKVTWTRYITRRFDSKAFKATHGELYEQYTRETEARRFAIA